MTAVLLTLGPRDLPAEDSLARVAERAGVPVGQVLHVDRLAERALTPGDAELLRLFGGGGETVAGCSRPRAARALLEAAGVELSSSRITWVTLPFDRDALKTEYGVPWYPVIDRARCTGCGTCHDYCLFSVYTCERAAGGVPRVSVTAPLNCKTGCPACARLCPEGALLFPFCAEAELNGELENPARRTRDTLTAALGDDPLRLLAERRQQKRLLDPEKFRQAETDRIRYSGVL